MCSRTTEPYRLQYLQKLVEAALSLQSTPHTEFPSLQWALDDVKQQVERRQRAVKAQEKVQDTAAAHSAPIASCSAASGARALDLRDVGLRTAGRAEAAAGDVSRRRSPRRDGAAASCEV